MIQNFAAFLGIAVLVIVTPGQDTALVIRNTLFGGRAMGTHTAFGVAGGQAVWTIAASAGIVALLQASEPAFAALRLAGAAYLVFLGAQALYAAVRPARAAHPGSRGAGVGGPWPGFRQGLVSNLGNPKMAVFFTSLLPQFVPAGEASFAGLLLLGLLFCLMTLVWLSGYALAVARAGDVLRRPSVRRAVEGITGAALVAFGVRLAADQR